MTTLQAKQLKIYINQISLIREGLKGLRKEIENDSTPTGHLQVSKSLLQAEDISESIKILKEANAYLKDLI